MPVSVCSREAEASVKAKLLDRSPAASRAHSMYGSHPARELSYDSSLQGGNGFPGPSPVSLSTPGAGGRSQVELAAIHAARDASASPLLAASMPQGPSSVGLSTPSACERSRAELAARRVSSSLPLPAPMSQSPPIRKIEIGQGTPQWKGFQPADVSPPAMKTAVRSAPRLPPSGQAPCGNDLQKAAGDAPSATHHPTSPSHQSMLKPAPFTNSVVSALPAKEKDRKQWKLPVEAPHSASPPPPIPDDILNYQPRREMRAKYRLGNAVALNQSKDEEALSISDETGAGCTRERRRRAQRCAMQQAPVQTPTALLSANHSVASPGSGHARYKALALSPEKHDLAALCASSRTTLAEAAVYEAAGYRSEGADSTDDLYATSQASKTLSGETLMVSPMLTVAPLESPVMRNVDQGSPLFTSSPGGWFGLSSPDTRPGVQLPPRAPPPLPAAVGQRACASTRGVAVKQHVGGGGSGAGGLWGSLEGGAGKCQVIFSESPHSVAARAGALAPGKL